MLYDPTPPTHSRAAPDLAEVWRGLGKPAVAGILVLTGRGFIRSGQWCARMGTRCISTVDALLLDLAPDSDAALWAELDRQLHTADTADTVAMPPGWLTAAAAEADELGFAIEMTVVTMALGDISTYQQAAAGDINSIATARLRAFRLHPANRRASGT